MRNGLFVQPVIFTGIPNDHTACAKREIFGPVTCVARFRDYEGRAGRGQRQQLQIGSSHGLDHQPQTTALGNPPPAGRLRAGKPEPGGAARLSHGGVKNSRLGK